MTFSTAGTPVRNGHDRSMLTVRVAKLLLVITAPLIMTILGSSQFFAGLDAPMDALPLRIWRLSLLPYDSAQLQGWGAALILILIILAVNIAVRYFVLGKKTGVIGSIIKQRDQRRV